MQIQTPLLLLNNRYTIFLTNRECCPLSSVPRLNSWLNLYIMITAPEPGTDTSASHHVIVNSEKVRARGDNNGQADPYTLTQGDITGRVVLGRRGKQNLRICNGTTGNLQARYYEMVKSLQKCLLFLIKPPYSFVSDHCIIRRWTGKRLAVHVLNLKYKPTERVLCSTL